MGYVATPEKLSIATSVRDFNAEREVQDLISAKENFNPNNYQDAWAAGEGFRALIHEYHSQQ